MSNLIDINNPIDYLWATRLEIVELKKTNKMNKQKLYARKCSITGEGMNKGFVLDGELYFKYEKDLLQHLKQLEKGYDKYMRFTDIWSLIEDYYNIGALSFEDWNNDKPQYVEINNKLNKL